MIDFHYVVNSTVKSLAYLNQYICGYAFGAVQLIQSIIAYTCHLNQVLLFQISIYEQFPKFFVTYLHSRYLPLTLSFLL